jgi:amino acid adenylation domain-containing protein
MITAQAERTPSAWAVAGNGQRLSYRELDARANQLARHLRRLGVGPEVLVGICVARSPEMLVGLLGILKAGGAYVPLDPDYPQDRLAFVAEDANLRFLLTQDDLAGKVSGPALRQVYLDRDWPAISQEDSSFLPAITEPGQLCYVLYTSGSTGRPKGVQIEHRNLGNLLSALQQQPGIKPADVLLAVTTLSFDIAGLELFLPLTVGAQVVLTTREQAGDGRWLMRLLAENGITIMQATPATWRLLLDAGWEGNPRLKILCGGEALPPGLARKLLPRCAELWNMYGPTETTIWSSVHRVLQADHGPVSIGRPIANTRMFILDDHRNPVPAGTEGELYIGGHGVARGYLRRPELTAEKFLPDPFQTDARAFLYRTGDLARQDPDGNFFFLGRIDNQVKVQGFRVEVEEIESRLAEHPAVRQSAVVLCEDASGDKHLAGYIVPTKGTATDGVDLRKFLQSRLPQHMIPSAFIFLEALPLTPNRKVDRKALQALPLPQAKTGVVAARDSVEARLVRLCQRVLKIESVGVTTSFFDLAVSSLAAARMFVEIGRVFGKDLPLSTLFHAPTIEALARLLRDNASAPEWSSLVPIQPQGSRPPLFFVHGGTGATYFLRPLSRHLGLDQPFYGLQMEGLDGRRISRTRVEEMAAHYLNDIRTLQPRGPYFIGGYCFGGVVAFEMAQQLRRAGEEVGLVALINAPNPVAEGDAAFDDEEEGEQSPRSAPSTSKEPMASLRRSHLSALLTLPLPAKLPYLRRALRSALAWRWRALNERILKPARNRLIETLCMLYVRMDRPVPPRWRNRYLLHLTHAAERRYVPRFFPGRMTIFHGAGLPPHLHTGWSGLAEDLVVCEIPGVHRNRFYTMQEPNVRSLAREIRSRMSLE